MDFGWTRGSCLAVSSAIPARRLPARLAFLVIPAFLAACSAARPSISLPPSSIESMEGELSFRFSSEGETTKTRLSFIFNLPREGRIHVLDGIGGVAAVILIEEDQSFFALPSRKVYWRGPWHTVAERFLGFPLTLRDMAELMSGQWSAGGGAGAGVGEETSRGWSFRKDDRGRISGGVNGDFVFSVKEFFDPGFVPRIVEFSHSAGEGWFTMRRLRFNTPVSVETFKPMFAETGRFRLISWEEMERIFRDEG